MTACEYCKKPIEDGVNGDIFPPPPWDEEGVLSACCYGCENQQMEEGEKFHVMESIRAAAKSRRMDCI